MKVFISKFSVAGLGATILMGAIVFISGCGKSELVDPEPVVRPVKLYTIESEGLNRIYEYPGQVQPKLQANLAFEVPGRLVSLTVEEAEKVSAKTRPGAL